MFTGSPYRYTNLDLANFRRMLTRAFDDTYRLTAEVTCLCKKSSGLKGAWNPRKILRARPPRGGSR